METKLTLVPTNALRADEQTQEKPESSYKTFKSRGKHQGFTRNDNSKSPLNQAQSPPQTNTQPPVQSQSKEVKVQPKEQPKTAEKSIQKKVQEQKYEPDLTRQEDFEDSHYQGRYSDFEQQGQQIDHKFVCEFPRAKEYSNLKIITQAFPHLKDVNTNALDIDGLQDLRCFIMRSNNEDDIHKAIKYGIWTSTQRSNDFLNKLYEECAPKNIPIFLFYSVVRSGQFVAVGQMVSKIIPKSFQYWWEADKWVNHFQVKWHYVKDLSYKHFSHLYMEDDLPVTRARDCTSVPLETTKEMLRIYRDFNPYNSIFNAFAYMDVREDMLRGYKQSMQAYQNYYTAGESYNAGYVPQANTQGYQANPQYFKYNSFPAKQKDANTNNQTLTKSFSPKKSTLNDLENLFKEFETTHAFYSEEKKKWKQDGEVMNKQTSAESSKYENLKSREKEILEGLELIESKYHTITEAFRQHGEKIVEKEVKERLKKRIESLNDLLEQFKKDFTESKDDIFSLYEKVSVSKSN